MFPTKTHSALLLTLLPTLVSCSPLHLERQPFPTLRPRGNNETNSYGEVNITAFPSCARASCIISQQFSPSRIGCNSAELTTDCLCHKAPAPLSCSPSGPSDENNCWYQLEDWFSGACGGNVTMVDPATIPECAQKCVFIALSGMGCRNPSRNCLCILDPQPVVDAAGSCVAQNCAKNMKMQPPFSAASWRDDICKVGQAAAFDQAAYNAYAKMVRDTRIAVPVVVVVIGAVAISTAACVLAEGQRKLAPTITMFLAVVVCLSIVLPVQFAL